MHSHSDGMGGSSGNCEESSNIISMYSIFNVKKFYILYFICGVRISTITLAFES